MIVKFVTIVAGCNNDNSSGNMFKHCRMPFYMTTTADVIKYEVSSMNPNLMGVCRSCGNGTSGRVFSLADFPETTTTMKFGVLKHEQYFGRQLWRDEQSHGALCQGGIDGGPVQDRGHCHQL
mmetsp:Transcript_23542/g.28765  ORF Transcript_23542/g.28765 Transcript_23542/m.28765 type:complete len:122 (-) Transcript_23542:22-387(-)